MDDEIVKRAVAELLDGNLSRGIQLEFAVSPGVYDGLPPLLFSAGPRIDPNMSKAEQKSLIDAWDELMRTPLLYGESAPIFYSTPMPIQVTRPADITHGSTG